MTFVKSRLTSEFSNVDISSHAKFFEWPFLDILCAYGAPVIESSVSYLFSDPKLEVRIEHNPSPNEGFEYFTMERCLCDGTLYYFHQLAEQIINKLIYAQTYNCKKYPKDIIQSLDINIIHYTVGDLVCCQEYGKYGTKDKPWLSSRFTVFLPIKFEIL